MKRNKKTNQNIIIVPLLPLELEAGRPVGQRKRSNYFQIGWLSLQMLYHQQMNPGSEVQWLIQEPRRCCWKHWTRVACEDRFRPQWTR
jgi:hypothetical protein